MGCSTCRFHSKSTRPIAKGADSFVDPELELVEVEDETVYLCQNEKHPQHGQVIGGADAGPDCQLYEVGRRAKLADDLEARLARKLGEVA